MPTLFMQHWVPQFINTSSDRKDRLVKVEKSIAFKQKLLS